MSTPQNVRIVLPPASAGQPWTFLLLLLAAALAAVGNTRIGWPTNEGVACIFAYGLMIGAVGVMIGTVVLRRVPPLLVPVAMMVAVLMLLQWLPEPESGLVIFPNLPWNYSGWIPVVLSVAAWFFLLLAIFTSGAYDAVVVVPLFLLWMLAFTLPLSYWSGDATSTAACSPWEQVAEWRMKKAETERVLVGLQSDRQELVEHLSRLGVRSTADFMGIPTARPLAKELAEVVKQIEVVQERNERLGAAIAEIESKLRRVGRREAIGEIGLTGEEENDLTRRQLVLEEELGESLLEVEEILKEVLSE